MQHFRYGYGKAAMHRGRRDTETALMLSIAKEKFKVDQR